MNKTLLLLAVALLFTLPVSKAHAQIDHLNVGEVVVSDQSIYSQKRAGKRAFEQVVTKMSGESTSNENITVRRAATNFEQYLISSSYRQEKEALIYRAEFNQDKIIGLLRSEGLRVWGKRRPSSLLWIAIEDDTTKDKTLLTQTTESDLKTLLNTAAFQRGIEVVFPLGDLSDSMNVSTNDVWGLYSSSIYNHSIRYGTNYVIGAKIGLGFDDYSASEKFILNYFVTDGQSIETAQVAGDSLPVLLGEFINRYADELGLKYAVSSDDTNETYDIVLKVSNVNSLLDYRTVLSILSSLTITKSVELVAQQNDVSEFHITTNVPALRLRSILKLENTIYEGDPASDDEQSLTYIWRGK